MDGFSRAAETLRQQNTFEKVTNQEALYDAIEQELPKDIGGVTYSDAAALYEICTECIEGGALLASVPDIPGLRMKVLELLVTEMRLDACTTPSDLVEKLKILSLVTDRVSVVVGDEPVNFSAIAEQVEQLSKSFVAPEVIPSMVQNMPTAYGIRGTVETVLRNASKA